MFKRKSIKSAATCVVLLAGLALGGVVGRAQDPIAAEPPPLFLPTPPPAAPTLTPFDNFSVGYAVNTPALGPEAIARGQLASGEDALVASYGYLLKPDLWLRLEDSLRFPHDQPLGNADIGQGDLSVNDFKLHAPYDSADKWTLDPFYSMSRWHYQERDLSLNDDFTVSALGLDTGYQLFPRTKLTSDVRLQEIAYNLATRDSESGQASMGIEQKLTAKLKAAGQFGVEQRETVGGPDQTAPTGDFNLSYDLLANTTLTVGHRYALTEADSADFLNETSRTYYSRLSQQLLPGLQLDTGAAFETDEMHLRQRTNLEPVGPRDCWRFDLAPSYRLNNDLSAQLGYSLRVFDTPLLQQAPLDSTVFLSLKLSY